jgi:hypothetical protein
MAYEGVSRVDTHRKAQNIVLNKMASTHSLILGDTNDSAEIDDEQKYAVILQTRWRSRQARLYCSSLLQESKCKTFRNSHPTGTLGVGNEENNWIVDTCEVCEEGESGSSISEKISRRQYQDVQRLLFSGQKKITVQDTGDNWNQRFQRALDMPEGTAEDKIFKYKTLSAINNDFVTSATRYAKTIISEYFLHTQHKSIRAKNFGGFAGGQKYYWRGILFKMADGSSGPWNGSDEAAARAAGQEMKGFIHYASCGVDELRYPLSALIDYRGFRMSAQAFLPLGKSSLKYGSSDAGISIHKDDPKLSALMEESARRLNIRGHVVGAASSKVITDSDELQRKTLFSAVDVGKFFFKILFVSSVYVLNSCVVHTMYRGTHRDGWALLFIRFSKSLSSGGPTSNPSSSNPS